MVWQKETRELKVPALQDITENYQKIKPFIRQTPVISWEGELKEKVLGSDTELFIKLELLQHAGSFKPRGGVTVSRALSAEVRQNGFVTVSAGNHGIALAYIARMTGVRATVCLPASANPYRLRRIRDLGAETIIAPDIHKAFELAEELEKKEGRFFFHPFEGYGVTLGQGSLALELAAQIPGGFDQIVLPVGGGGLCSGVSAGLKQHPQGRGVRVIAVEPEGADAMSRSFREQRTVTLGKVTTIADSLGSPVTLPYSFELCKKFVDEILLVSDQKLLETMKIIYEEFSMLVEPACAAGFASILNHPEKFRGKKNVVLFCGSNIDVRTWADLTGAV